MAITYTPNTLADTSSMTPSADEDPRNPVEPHDASGYLANPQWFAFASADLGSAQTARIALSLSSTTNRPSGAPAAATPFVAEVQTRASVNEPWRAVVELTAARPVQTVTLEEFARVRTRHWFASADYTVIATTPT